MKKWYQSDASDTIITSVPIQDVSTQSAKRKYSGLVAAARNHQTTRIPLPPRPTPVMR